MSYWTRRALLAGVAALALTLGVPGVQAQQNGNAAPGGGRRGGRQGLPPGLIAHLGLSADQQAKEQKARTEMRSAMEGARTLTGPDRRMAMQKAGEDYQTALNGILTPAQKTKLQALMAEARELRGLGPIGQQLLSVKPALTADQKSKVKAIAAKYQPEMQNFRRGRGGPGGGAAGGDPNARTERRALMEKVAAEVKAVLTPEQQSTLRPLGGRRGLRGQQQ